MAIWGYAVKPATSFISRIFKKPSSPDGYAKFINPDPRTGGYYPGEEKIPFLKAFLNRQPMTAKMKADCTKFVLARSINWTKACKKNLQAHCANIQVIPDPPPPPPIVHKVSPSYKPVATTKTITKSRDVTEVVQAGLFKIPANLKTPLFILAGGIAILSIFILVKGGAR